MKRKIVPGTLPTKDLHQYLVGAVAPRPIAFVSTLDEDGVPNLAPYSFFNTFSSNPPIMVFSSNRKVSDNTTKDTLHNVRVSGECVINVVTYPIVRQTALASVEFLRSVNEFEKIGLTPEPAETVKPARVKESPVNFECKVKEIIELGDQGGAGHLIICEVQLITVSEEVIDGNRIDPHKLDLMGRMGRAYYVRASGDAIMEIYQPFIATPIGFDRLPEKIKNSKILTGNELGYLAALNGYPSKEDVVIDEALYALDYEEKQRKASIFIAEGKINEAMALLYY
ncbi:MAG: flavin reductase family protein [Chitinophagales bacterium]|nr:flavin reductase family protein [Chitinophagales bacterium]